MSTTALAVLSATCTVLLVLLLLGSPGEEEIVPLKPRVGTGPASDLSPLTAELAQLKTLLAEQQAATLEHRELVAQFAAGQASVSGGVAGEAAGGAAGGAAAAAAPLADSAELERAALAACTPGDVPILGVMRSPCPPGMHGYGCKVRWDLGDRFVPEGGRWLSEFNASHRAVVNCQRGFFDAFAERLARAHWETEWDAQPFRIAAAPPRTIGKMMHQLTTANYFQLTSSPTQGDKAHRRLPLRSAAAPGSHYVRMPDPGFRWNVLDYGKGNIFADPLRHGTRCAKSHSAWHCLWQRFPHQRAARSAPPPESALGTAADELYNLSRSGRATRRLVQYLIMTGVTQVFSEPTVEVASYVRDRMRLLCHRGGPHCGGSADEQRTPVAAVHVRQGDSCDRHSDTAGPFNSMFAWDAKKGKVDRVGFRYCYSWGVYAAMLRQLQREYGVRTVLLMTDDSTGKVLQQLPKEQGFNWAYLDFPRQQFVKKGWMEFRSDLDENVPFSLAAAFEMLGGADMLVGNMGSHVTRVLYNKMVASSRTSTMPPFISVDGYGLCCDFTEDCSKDDIRKRNRPIRDCIHKYGQCTGGDQYFFHRG